MSERSKAYRLYLKSDHWQELRQLKFKEVGKQCQHCGRNHIIHCHHVRYKNYINVITSDLVALCESCHDDFHRACGFLKRDYIGIEKSEIDLIISDFRLTEKYKKWKNKIQNRRASRAIKIPRTHRNSPPRTLKRLVRDCNQSNQSRESLIRLIDYAKSLLIEPTTVLSKEINPPILKLIPTIEDLKSSTKGWTRIALADYGIGWPPPKGWRKNLLKKNKINHPNNP